MSERKKDATAIQVAAWVKAGGKQRRSIGRSIYLDIDDASARWFFRYRQPGTSKIRTLGLGSFPDVGLAEARKRADDARAQIRAGRDPLDVKAAERQAAQVARAQADAKQRAVTFKQVALDYIRAHDPGWKSRKHSSQWLSTLEAYAFPHIGEMAPARDLDE